MRFLPDGHLPPSPQDERTSRIRLRSQRPMTYLQRNSDVVIHGRAAPPLAPSLPFYDQSGCRTPSSFRTSTSCSRTLLSLRPECPRTPTYYLLRIPQLLTNPRRSRPATRETTRLQRQCIRHHWCLPARRPCSLLSYRHATTQGFDHAGTFARPEAAANQALQNDP